MKNFYRVSEKPYNEETYYTDKRDVILETIKPICEAFGIADYNYIIDRQKGIERLVIEGQAIGCMNNSIGATVEELIAYIFVKGYMPERYFAFKPQIKSALKCYWIKE